MASSSKSINMPITFVVTIASVLLLLAIYTGTMAFDEYVKQRNIAKDFETTPQHAGWSGAEYEAQKPSAEAVEAAQASVADRYND